MNWKCMSSSPAGKRYGRRMAVAMALYMVFLFGSLYLLQHGQPTRWVALSLAVLPSLPLILVVAILGRYLKEETDEFQRSVLVECLLWGLGCTLALSSVWGLLEVIAHVPHLPIFYVFPGFWFFFGIATPFVKMRYRGSEVDE